MSSRHSCTRPSLSTVFSAIFAVLVGLAIVATPVAHPAFASQNDADKAGIERKLKEKAQRKKDKKFNREIQFRHAVGPNVLPLGPFTFSLYIHGNLLEGRLSVAIQAKDSTAKATMESEKATLMGIIYPMAMRMYENGRPTTDSIRDFKRDVTVQLRKRFKKLVEEFFIVSVI
ncbi:MAG: hypothetical protein HOL85_14365 [Rhodospirillaceae bacterium]|nr:hypothetical protein [Rhodospirillaceae bacterium]